MNSVKVISNPDLTVGVDNKQRWNQAAHRRHGFHNAHRLFRRSLMVRSRNVLVLEPEALDPDSVSPELVELMANPAFSACCCLRGDKVILQASAADFAADLPHSIQSISKLHIHIIIGRLLEQGLLSLDAKVARYLPYIGSGYAEATVQSLLDMSVTNNFTEDYSDPNSDCYNEEIALGWRLPETDVEEVTLTDFAAAISGFRESTSSEVADYKSANTDVLTLIAAAVSPEPLAAQLETIVDAVGYEGAFHISLSRDGYPAFSGGGCLSARDLARFGLFIARGGRDLSGRPVANQEFFEHSLVRTAPALSPPKQWLRYSNHLMTDGRVVGHAGYGGQFLMVDTETQASCAFLSVLLNDAGYDDNYMAGIASVLEKVCTQI